jgi:hypothetical protein
VYIKWLEKKRTFKHTTEENFCYTICACPLNSMVGLQNIYFHTMKFFNIVNAWISSLTEWCLLECNVMQFVRNLLTFGRRYCLHLHCQIISWPSSKEATNKELFIAPLAFSFSILILHKNFSFDFNCIFHTSYDSVEILSSSIFMCLSRIGWWESVGADICMVLPWHI